tara:strand:- start:140 stop:253 length:114 start_codon:yes stop_codon:yes gene_type:complete
MSSFKYSDDLEFSKDGPWVKPYMQTKHDLSTQNAIII